MMSLMTNSMKDIYKKYNILLNSKYFLFIFYQRKNISNLQKKDYSEHFQTLGIAEESDQAAAREAFLKLAKIYHPDSGHAKADAVKFQKIEEAYRQLLQKFSHERRNNDWEGEFGLYYNQKRKKQEEEEEDKEDDDKIYDIKHTAPQHRQYLSYEGIGIGTPSQREKQYRKFKAMRAAENIIEHKVQQLSQENEETALTAKEKKGARDIRTRYGIDRLVEDKIQESIARGDFDNLPNAGKPLKYQNHNPFVDTVTHKLNQVLIDNGYAPEWVMLEREIREDKTNLKQKLSNYRCQLGSYPLSKSEEVKWNAFLFSLLPALSDLNKKIDKYNFVVPILTKQTVHFPLTQVGEKILKEGKTKEIVSSEERKEESDKMNSKEFSSSSLREDLSLKAIIDIFKGR